MMYSFKVIVFEFSIPEIKIHDFLRKPVNVKTLVRRVKLAMAN